MMLDKINCKTIAENLVLVAEQAGEIILKARAEGAAVRSKSDDSPVTAADERCEAFLLGELKRLFPDIPTISEESGASACLQVDSRRYFLIDPLDGTKEFIKGHDEFTINIALVEDGIATMGILHVPAQNRLFFSWGPGDAYEKQSGSSALTPLRLAQAEEPMVLVSRSHLDDKTKSLLNKLGPHQQRGLGSAFKFALIANGEAQLYPRFAPTMLWDTAAGQAIIEAVGGVVVTLDGERLRYDPAKGLRNPDFLAASSSELAKDVLRKLHD